MVYLGGCQWCPYPVQRGSLALWFESHAGTWVPLCWSVGEFPHSSKRHPSFQIGQSSHSSSHTRGSFAHSFIHSFVLVPTGHPPCANHCCRNQGFRSEQGMVLALVKLMFSRGSANPKQTLEKFRLKKKSSMNSYQVLEKPSPFCLDFSECHLLPPSPAQVLSPSMQRTPPALSSLNSVTQGLVTHNYIINTQLLSNCFPS